jgi:hypothetical protein
MLVEAEVVKRRSLRHGPERWRSYLCRQRAGPACKWKEVVKSETEVAKAVALEKSRACFAPSPKRAKKNSVSKVYASFESVGKLIFSDAHSLLVVSTGLWEATRQGGVDASVARGVLDEALCGRQVLVRDGCRMSEKGAPVPEIFRGTCSGVEGGFCRDGQPLAVVVEFELYGEVGLLRTGSSITCRYPAHQVMVEERPCDCVAFKRQILAAMGRAKEQENDRARTFVCVSGRHGPTCAPVASERACILRRIQRRLGRRPVTAAPAAIGEWSGSALVVHDQSPALEGTTTCGSQRAENRRANEIANFPQLTRLSLGRDGRCDSAPNDSAPNAGAPNASGRLSGSTSDQLQHSYWILASANSQYGIGAVSACTNMACTAAHAILNHLANQKAIGSRPFGCTVELVETILNVAGTYSSAAHQSTIDVLRARPELCKSSWSMDGGGSRYSLCTMHTQQ